MDKEIKVKPIRGTVITFDNPQDYQNFIDWTNGKYVEGLSHTPEERAKIIERIKNHVPSKRRTK
ncbi:hypothetical protein [Paenibacillus xylanexedens]|uniref:hypothetical protein n=1 Tax=Paenibacillus xylanexedens TaxID=528191 RepID=UPI000F537836|nr:hypothetical protein [Paenibacillus xylanexedens]